MDQRIPYHLSKNFLLSRLLTLKGGFWISNFFGLGFSGHFSGVGGESAIGQAHRISRPSGAKAKSRVVVVVVINRLTRHPSVICVREDTRAWTGRGKGGAEREHSEEGKKLMKHVRRRVEEWKTYSYLGNSNTWFLDLSVCPLVGPSHFFLLFLHF